MSPMRATCPTHLHLIDFMNLLTFSEEYELQISYQSNYLQLPQNYDLKQPQSPTIRTICCFKGVKFGLSTW
jgi:hypothetical protein